MKTLIKNVYLYNKTVDILIKDNLINKISDTIEDKEAEVFDATNLAVLPAFYNMHAHSSMSLLRGFCEDLPLFDWLNNIWKREATLSAEDIYNGTRLAILEMIKSGTVFFADMYWHHSEIIRAVEEMGIRANVGICFMNSLGRKTIEENFDFAKNPTITKPSLVSLSIAPHAIYTCDKDLYKECYSFAKKHDLIFHTHLSETQKEVEDSLKENGLRPVEYLNSLGVLDNKTLLAHCVHLSEKEAEILSQIAVKGIQEKKGKNITIIDFDGVDGSLFEYYVICTANSPTHVDAITDSIDKEIKQATGLNPRKVEGLQNCQWVLLDYFDVVVHVFLEETREFYNIEAMWKDVKQTHLEDIE